MPAGCAPLCPFPQRPPSQKFRNHASLPLQRAEVLDRLTLALHTPTMTWVDPAPATTSQQCTPAVSGRSPSTATLLIRLLPPVFVATVPPADNVTLLPARVKTRPRGLHCAAKGLP